MIVEGPKRWPKRKREYREKIERKKREIGEKKMGKFDLNLYQECPRRLKG
jgi:hypothetical protein